VPGYATRIALRELGRRAQFPGAQLGRLDELISSLVTARAPGLLALYGIGPDTAALLLIAAGDHPERLVQGAFAVPPLAQPLASFVLRATYSSTYSGRMRLLPPSLMERI
jgi:hypothetical protein